MPTGIIRLDEGWRLDAPLSDPFMDSLRLKLNEMILNGRR